MSVEESILELCRKYPAGLQEDVLATELPNISVSERATAINGLLAKKRLDILSQGGNLWYKEIKDEELTKLKGLSNEDLHVYQLIKASNTAGIWTKNIKRKSNLAQPQMAKALKTLEARKLIKLIKSVASKNKVYILYELEPSKEITGGAWYTEDQFDEEFIEVLREHCHKFIAYQGRATLEDICDFVSKTGMSKVELRPEDILQVVGTLMYDGKVDATEEMTPDQDEDIFYSPTTLEIPTSRDGGVPLTSVPCGVCPVLRECHPEGLISPSTCVYYNDWLAPAGDLDW